MNDRGRYPRLKVGEAIYRYCAICNKFYPPDFFKDEEPKCDKHRPLNLMKIDTQGSGSTNCKTLDQYIKYIDRLIKKEGSDGKDNKTKSGRGPTKELRSWKRRGGDRPRPFKSLRRARDPEKRSKYRQKIEEYGKPDGTGED